MSIPVGNRPEVNTDGQNAAAVSRIHRGVVLLQTDLLQWRSARLIVICTLLSLCAVRTYFGGPIIAEKYGPDAFIVLDGAWRVVNGQIPHVDFHTAVGPVLYLLGAFALTLSSSSVLALSYAQAMAGAVFGLWAYRIATRRLAAIPAIGFSVLVVLVAIAPYEIGESPLALAPSTTYNRYSYALLVLLLLDLLCPPRAVRSPLREEWVGALSSGIALGLLLFLKISFFVAGILLLFAALFYRRPGKLRCVGYVLGFSLVLVCMAAYLRGDVAAVWNDWRMAAAGKKIPTRVAADIFVRNAGQMLSLVFLAAFASLAAVKNSRLHTPLFAIAVCGVSYMVILGNHQETGMPLLAVFAIALASRLLDDFSIAAFPDHFSLTTPILLVWCAFVFTPLIVSDVASLGYGAWKSVSTAPASVLTFDSPRLKPLLFTSSSNLRDFGRAYVACANEGIQIVRSEPLAAGSVVTLANTDPFPHALDKVPARWGATWIADGNNMSAGMKPAPDKMFTDASAVLVSRYVTDGGAVRLFGPYVKQNFRLARESSCWELYVRQ